MLSVLLVCVFTVTWADGFVSTGPATLNHSFPNHCYDTVLKKGYAPGSMWKRPDECVEYLCRSGWSKDSGKPQLQITATWCKKVHTDKSCILKPGNNSLPFPSCCKNVKCPFKRSKKKKIRSRE